MNINPIVSLCMPTNGVVEWVFPVLESIYSQGIDETCFEVVITDNGHNDDFKAKIKDFVSKHQNIVYAETEALPFINEIESYKMANGELIKFVNHRTRLIDGSLQKLIDFVEKYRKERPIVYYSNGVLEIEKRVHEYESFDQFVKNLSYWSSWSTGMTIWKDDFEKLPKDVSNYNELFPHTNVLFNERHREKYIIDNSKIFNEIPQGKKPKGDYDLFFAFGVEYPWIICTLLRDKDISLDTFRFVIDKNLGFVAYLYYHYCIRKKYCSYNLSGEKDMYGVFYTKQELLKKVAVVAAKSVARFMLRR